MTERYYGCRVEDGPEQTITAASPQEAAEKAAGPAEGLFAEVGLSTWVAVYDGTMFHEFVVGPDGRVKT